MHYSCILINACAVFWTHEHNHISISNNPNSMEEYDTTEQRERKREKQMQHINTERNVNSNLYGSFSYFLYLSRVLESLVPFIYLFRNIWMPYTWMQLQIECNLLNFSIHNQMKWDQNQIQPQTDIERERKRMSESEFCLYFEIGIRVDLVKQCQIEW